MPFKGILENTGVLYNSEHSIISLSHQASPETLDAHALTSIRPNHWQTKRDPVGGFMMTGIHKPE